MRDVAARIAELIDLFASADSILIRTLDDPLSREALGLTPTGAPVAEPASGDD